MPIDDEERGDLVEECKNQLVALEGALKKMAEDTRKLTTQPHTLVQVKSTIGMLDNLYDQASSVLLRMEGFEGTHQRREPLMATYFKTKVELENLAQSLRAPAQGRAQEQSLDQSIQPTASRADHLPRIELPRFNGSPTEWLSFKSRFEKTHIFA